MLRVSRNFWILVIAAVLSVGMLSTAVRMPPSPLAGALTAVTGIAAVTALALAGRILVLASGARMKRKRPSAPGRRAAGLKGR